MIKYFAKNFYRDMGLLRFIGIYVLGDALVLVPFLLIFLPLMYFLAGGIGVGVAWCVYMIFRNFIEIIYWLFHQFSDKKEFRPEFPFKEFGNNEIYIIYQLLNTIHTIIYAVLLIFILR